MQYIEPRPGIGYVLLENFFNMFLGQKLSYFRQNKARILESRWHLTPPPPTWIFYKSVIPW